MATHYWDQDENAMKPVEPGSTVNTNTTFLLMRDGRVHFDGTAPELGTSRDEYIREFIS
jgi:hypothetical protein